FARAPLVAVTFHEELHGGVRLQPLGVGREGRSRVVPQVRLVVIEEGVLEVPAAVDLLERLRRDVAFGRGGRRGRRRRHPGFRAGRLLGRRPRLLCRRGRFLLARWNEHQGRRGEKREPEGRVAAETSHSRSPSANRLGGEPQTIANSSAYGTQTG